MIYECVMSSQSDTVQLPVLKTVEGAEREWRIWLKESPGESAAPLDLGDAGSVVLVVKETPAHRVAYLRKTALIINPAEGMITLTFFPEDMTTPGLWWGAFQVFNRRGNLVQQIECRILVARSATSVSDNAPLTVTEVRNFLMDRCPEDNRLLLAEQFTDDQIINAMALPVSEWNDTPPQMGQYSTVTFPWPRPLLLGTCASLLQTAAFNQTRNNATYQTGNTTVNDSDKGPAFMQLSERLMSEWRSWMLSKKRELNIRNGWGSSSISEF